MPEAPQHIIDDLKGIRPTLELKWRERAVLVRHGSYDATGMVTQPDFEPRWELWDVDSEGAAYKVMTLQTSPAEDPIRFPDGGQFKPPGDWLVHLMRFLNPERFNGNLNDLLHEALDEPERLREAGTEADQDDLFEMIGKWAAYVRTEKDRNLKTMNELAVEHAQWQAARGRTPALPAAHSLQEA